MKKLFLNCVQICLVILLTLSMTGCAENSIEILSKPDDIRLPAVNYNQSASLSDALKNRKSSRSFSKKELDMQTVSNLLWSANGINRKNGKKTAPSALNRQEIELYVVFPDTAYIYLPNENILKAVSNTNIETLSFHAPFTVVHVANLGKQAKKYALVDCGFIGQNIYLFSAANKLNTVFQGNIDQRQIHTVLKLPNSREALFIQQVGYPKD